MRSTGLDVGVYFDRWLLATAILFGASALLFALRIRWLARTALPQSA